MVEMWYYTCEGKQMDPVPIRDLKGLVGDGVLKPTDMVWKEGMSRWIRASSLKELFPDPASALDQYFSSSAAAPAEVARSEPASTPRPRPSADDDEHRPERRRRGQLVEEEDDDRDRPRRRRPVASRGGYGTQILIGSVVGGFVVLACLVIGILIFAAPRRVGRAPLRIAVPAAPVEFPEAPAAPPQPAVVTKAEPAIPDDVKTGSGVLPIAVSLAPGAEHIVKFRVKARQAATITVTPLPAPGKIIDLNMQVFKESDNALVAADEAPSASASVTFTLPATEIVRVRVHNASRKATVTQFTFVYSVGN